MIDVEPFWRGCHAWSVDKRPSFNGQSINWWAAVPYDKRGHFGAAAFDRAG